MSNVTSERKERVIKTLALLGLFGIIICIAWLSIQIISLLPSATNSLASIADSVYNYDPKAAKTIKFIDSPTNFTTGVASTIKWEKPISTGTYSFSYRCGKDVFIEIESTENKFTGLECNKNYNVGNVDSVLVTIYKDNTEAIDLEYTISHFKTNATAPSATKTISAGIINGEDIAISPSTSVEVTVNDKPVTPKPTQDNQNTTKPTVTPKPTTTYTYTYTLPVSDPKGNTDLKVSYLGIGTVDNNENFTSTGSLKQNIPGAIQFTVHNIGTKTSTDWTFSTILPGGVEYTSKVQAPLKPNEKTTLTLSFPAVSELKLQRFTFEVETEEDKDKTNNKITWSTIVLN